MSPAERFIKLYVRMSLVEELFHGILAAAVGFAVLVGGGKLYFRYGSLIFGNETGHYAIVVLLAALTSAFLMKIRLSRNARLKRGLRATRILNILSRAGSKVKVINNCYTVHPYGDVLTNREFEVFKATFGEGSDLPIIIPPRLLFDGAVILKNGFYLLIISAVAWYFWQRYAASGPDSAAVAGNPASVSAPVKTRRHPIQEGVYYLLTRVSITTDTGVTGIPRGTRVTIVRFGYPMRVTDGQHEFDVTSTQITNDLDILQP